MEVERQLFAGLKFHRKRFKKDIALFEVTALTDPTFKPQTLNPTLARVRGSSLWTCSYFREPGPGRRVADFWSLLARGPYSRLLSLVQGSGFGVPICLLWLLVRLPLQTRSATESATSRIEDGSKSVAPSARDQQGNMGEGEEEGFALGLESRVDATHRKRDGAKDGDLGRAKKSKGKGIDEVEVRGWTQGTVHSATCI